MDHNLVTFLASFDAGLLHMLCIMSSLAVAFSQRGQEVSVWDTKYELGGTES